MRQGIAMRFAGYVFALTLLVGWQGNVTLADNTSTNRALFLAAEKALRSGNHQTFRNLLGQLNDYPLTPYLHFYQITGQLKGLSNKEAQAFLEQFNNTVVADRFRDSWLNYLAKRKRWSDYLLFYEKDWSTIRHCHYLNAMVQTGQTQQVLPEITEMWLYPKSRPEACDPAFKALVDSGSINSQLAWQRISMAMNKGQTRLARYLSRWLSQQDQQWVVRWIDIHRHPDKVMDQRLFKQHHPYRETILSHGIKRQSRTDPIVATENWKILRNRYTFSPLIELLTERKLALAMLRSESPDAYPQLQQFTVCAHDTRLLETRLLAALKHQDWQRLLDWMEELPPYLANSEQWQYWKARGLEKTGQAKSARSLLTELAALRSYYGYLAADHLQLPYNIDNRVTPVSDRANQAVLSNPSVLRAQELVKLQRWQDARREWQHALKEMSRTELMAAAKLAQSWDWYDQAIFTLARTGYWEDLDLRFPLEHKNQVSSAAQRTDLDMEWIYAVIRQESAFNPSVRSHAGAVGLMQLMPKTARQVATKMLKQSAPSSKQLKEPRLNIKLGSTYLEYVHDRLNDHPVLATAAYNAGPHRVDQWMPEQTMPADIWIELIPFRETRGYVKRVMTYAVIYNHLLGKNPVRMSSRMPAIEGSMEKNTAAATRSIPAS
ncbi:MAG: transglycosylase SLT domain-containing protein [bacterium]